MFSNPSSSTWFKGDTFLEVLARTDLDDPASTNIALEVVKRYVRTKIKKGKGKEVAAKGGKLEALEVKYAHLGYQDIFYLARLQLSLPPSAVKLPRPNSPARKVLVKAKYPLDPEYQISRDDPRPSVSETASVKTARTERRRLEAERKVSHRRSGEALSSAITPHPSARLAEITSIPSPPSESSRHDQGQPPERTIRRVDSSASTASSATHASRRPRPGPEELDVKRMLEARIKALQSALTSLEVDNQIPIPSKDSHDRPLPSLPSPIGFSPSSPDSVSRLRVQNPDSPIPAQLESPGSTRKLPLPSPPPMGQLPSRPRGRFARDFSSPDLVLSLEDIPADPFASYTGMDLERLHREQPWRTRDPLLRSKTETERVATPPPMYELRNVRNK